MADRDRRTLMPCPTIRAPAKGRPVAIDHDAASADPKLPAFLARPPGAPVYHGFPLLDDVEVDGFTLGKISDFEAEEMDCGDAFVVAPDGTRAGLVWETGDGPRIQEVMPPKPGRWEVWAVWFSHSLRTRDDARLNLAEILPLLRPKWEAARLR